MGHLKPNDLPKPDARDTSAAQPAKSRWWLWLVILGVIAVGVWYYRASRSTREVEGASGARTSGTGKSGAGMGNFVTPVVVTTAQRGDLPVYLNGLGTVTAFNTVTVRSRVDGQIVKVNFTEGQFVHEGGSLVEIDPRPFQVMLEQAQGQFAKDQAQLKDAQVNWERYQLLYKEGVIAKQQLDTQSAQVGQFEGAIKADQATIDNAKLQITYSHITAPISGRLGLRLVDIGNIVHASDSNGLLVIAQLQPISVIFSLPQDQLPQVAAKLRSGAQLSVDAYDRNDSTKIATGKLATIDNQIDPSTGTFKLKSIFNNENNALFPNQFVNVHLLLDIRRNLVIVPAAGIQRGPQGTYVYVVSNDNTANMRTVTVTQTTGNYVGLSAGLNPGDVVVIDGQDKLQENSKVSVRTSTGSSTGTTAGTQDQPGAQTPAHPHGKAPSQSGGEKR